EQNLYLEREPTKEEVLEAVRAELKKWPRGCLVKICGYGEPVLRMDNLSCRHNLTSQASVV
ncbi:unnamed protein product, partial [marine sediment metagenome]